MREAPACYAVASLIRPALAVSPLRPRLPPFALSLSKGTNKSALNHPEDFSLLRMVSNRSKYAEMESFTALAARNSNRNWAKASA